MHEMQHSGLKQQDDRIAYNPEYVEYILYIMLKFTAWQLYTARMSEKFNNKRSHIYSSMIRRRCVSFFCASFFDCFDCSNWCVCSRDGIGG